MTPKPQPAHQAAFQAFTPEQRDRIAQAFAPAIAQAEALRVGLEPLARQTAAIRFALGSSGKLAAQVARIAEAEEMQARIWQATPRDRRPEVRRLFRRLESMSMGAVIAALAEALRFIQDPFYRLAPSGRAWGIVWAFWQAIHGTAPTLTRSAVRDRSPAEGGGTVTISERREARTRPERRPCRLASRLSPNAPPRRSEPRPRAMALALSATEHRGPP